MLTLSFKPGHDGSIACIEDGKLLFSLEAVKDSFPRYSDVTPQLIIQASEMMPALPDVVAIGGWHKHIPGLYSGIAAGYFGLDHTQYETTQFFGKAVKKFSSTRERSHIYLAAGLAPLAPMEECIVLVWEGHIGSFYHWQHFGAEISPIPVLSQPGARYSALFALGDPRFPDRGVEPREEDAGKLMALAGWHDGREVSPEDKAVVESLLQCETLYPFNKASYQGTQLYNSGVDTPRMYAAARFITERLFEIFLQTALGLIPRGLPLVISGGCGLNCEWNQRWRASGLFSDVFVPPCTNDSGSAIGTAIDAMVHFGDPCRLDWTVYSGAPFIWDLVPDPRTWTHQPLNHDAVARRLAGGEVFAWVQGRCEIGPRALGHRSLFASPLDGQIRDVLNAIKEREAYRPIAPCCMYQFLDKWFDASIDDPYMLYFSKVKTSALPAVTHADNSARVQSVRHDTEPRLHKLLEAFNAVTGYAVLCNTSLNFKGTGFINRMSELIRYCEAKRIDQFVVDDSWYSRH